MHDWRKKYGQVVEGRLNHRGESAEQELQRLRQEALVLTKERDLRFTTTTKADPKAAPAPNLLERCFETEEPNKVWVTDIT